VHDHRGADLGKLPPDQQSEDHHQNAHGVPVADMASLIRQTAGNLGIHPSDLGTAISYETGGTFDPSLWGGKGGKYLGLIQAGPEEQAKYGIRPGMPLEDHFKAIEGFLRDRGVKPGMGMLDLYSTINAGSPGRYNASDANNGGMPGTVADKVATQMVGHRARANAMLGDTAAPDTIAPPVQQAGAAQPGADTSGQPTGSNALGSLDGGVAPPAAAAAPAAGMGMDANTQKYLAAIKGDQQQQQQEDPLMSLSPAPAPGLAAASQLAAAMQRLSQRQG
jgi:hypothetical protein